MPPNLDLTHMFDLTPQPRLKLDGRAVAVQQLVVRHDVELSTRFVLLSLVATATAQHWSTFWKRWVDLYTAGVERDAFWCVVVAALVARSGNIGAMEELLSVHWSGMYDDLTSGGLAVPDELVSAVQMCLERVDPKGVEYPDIRSQLGL
ncbi:hypothetical protein V1512DRAFT_265254 [Lipomyces arxii]|uniref:uncharacterized protein n=1 Tax=Lipomyces arxii TaxID=56418 RepID=UPI0034CD3CF9